MTSEQIANIIIAVLPNVVTLFAVIGMVFRIVHSFRALKAEVTDMKAVKEVNDKLTNVLQENYELKKKLNELLTKIDHVERR